MIRFIILTRLEILATLAMLIVLYCAFGIAGVVIGAGLTALLSASR